MKLRNFLKRKGSSRWSPAANCFLLKYVALWDCFLEDKGSPSTKRIEIMSEIWKQARNSCLNRRSIRHSDLRRSAQAPFRLPFRGPLLSLVETTPPLADMLNSFESRGNLRGTMQLLESVAQPVHHLAVPQLYNKNLKRTKRLSLNRPPNKTCRASL